MQELSPEICQAIDKVLAKFPVDQKQSAVISALMLVQKSQGWIDVADMDLLADYLAMPRIFVYEVASFYSMFDLKPCGKHKIYVCTNISCMLNGSEKIVEHLKNKLKINLNETTKDGKFTLKSAECLAACAGAPMLQLDETYHENLTLEKVDKILGAL